ncbi:lysosomal Pro-X carboxypeptidase isoform X2 [Zootermopsis nevadensis]|nr:lysosomal Pro-X carboxypeptidase isoform X2 [Zootermopsis nevadensis]
MWETAPEFRALIVFAEHRYYGQSLPFGNNSYSEPKYLGYLTSEQALADYALVIAHLQKDQDRRSPVIAFGGSYGGMLAAYFRMKYPHVVAGAIAASAPIFQFSELTPCEAFSRIVTADYNSASAECAASIRKSWAAINNVTKTDAGKSWLSTMWKLCKPLKTLHDVKDLKGWLSDVYTNLAMINYPYATNFLAPVPANPISVMCSHLPNSSLTDKLLVKSLFKAVSIYFNYTGSSKCLNIETEASSNLGDLGWDFQACTEMVMPMCSDGHNDMFEVQIWDFAKYSETCYKKWKVRPDEKRAVRFYGGKDISTATNIVFSNGLLDPWSSGGVLYNVSNSTVAVIIPEGAHHLDLRESNPADPVSVRTARKFHRKFIRLWLRNYRLPA